MHEDEKLCGEFPAQTTCLFPHIHNNKKTKKVRKIYSLVSFPPFFRAVGHTVGSFSSAVGISLALCFHFRTGRSDSTCRDGRGTRPTYLDGYSTPIPISSYRRDPFLKQKKKREMPSISAMNELTNVFRLQMLELTVDIVSITHPEINV